MQKINVPTYIPLVAAVQKYGILEKTLLKRIKSGKLASAQLPDGEYLVAEHDIDPSLRIKREDFKHLRGQGISVTNAGKKYDIRAANFSRWTKLGYIKVLERGWKLILDEADVAYCAAVYRAKYTLYDGQLSGVNIFDKEGRPYRLRYREIADTRRNERRQQKQQESRAT